MLTKDLARRLDGILGLGRIVELGLVGHTLDEAWDTRGCDTHVWVIEFVNIKDSWNCHPCVDELIYGIGTSCFR